MRSPGSEPAWPKGDCAGGTVRLYGCGEIDDVYVLRETRASWATRSDPGEQRKQIEAHKRRMADLERAGDVAEAFCRRARERPGPLDYDEKRLLLSALQTRVVVHPDQLHVHGIMPSYATIERSSGCLICLQCDHNSREESARILPKDGP